MASLPTVISGSELFPLAISTQASFVANLIEDNWHKAAHAIMTTDTFAKGYSKRIEIEGHVLTSPEHLPCLALLFLH
jgi:N-acetylglutamate synthase/N-acetylornithine aminotransferase